MAGVDRSVFYLLDTHVLYWMQSEPSRLSRRARQVLLEAQEHAHLAISVFTLYELAQMLKRGRISARGSIRDSIRLLSADIPVLPLTLDIVCTAMELPDEVPRDPGDRLIMATSIVEGIPLITADKSIRASKVVKTIW